MKGGQFLWVAQAITFAFAFEAKDAANKYFESDIQAHLEKFQSIAEEGGQPDNNRFMGSDPHKKTLDYIKSQLEKWEYDVDGKEIETFYCESNTAEVEIDGETIEDSSPFWYSPSGTAEGEVVIIENHGTKESDFGDSVKDKIALIQRGGDSTSAFGDRVNFAREAGAKAVILYNNRDGKLQINEKSLLTLSNPDAQDHEYVPTVGVTKKVGEELVAKLAEGKVEAKIDSECDKKDVETHNLLAETKSGSGDKVLLIGAHTDSVRDGPGINDNGSGTATLLALAKFFKEFYNHENKVRFAFWTGEEEGLIGSYKYVASLSDDDREKIKLYFNIDTIGSPNGINTLLTEEGNDKDTAGKYQREYYDATGEPYDELDVDPSIDAWPFMKQDVRVVAIDTGLNDPKGPEEAEKFGGDAGEPYDANYHTAGDTIDNVNMQRLGTSIKTIIYTAAKWSESFDGL